MQAAQAHLAAMLAHASGHSMAGEEEDEDDEPEEQDEVAVPREHAPAARLRCQQGTPHAC